MFRQALEADLPHIQKLVDELYADDPNTQGLTTDVRRTFVEFQNKPDKGQLIVFDEDGTVAGYCIIIFFWSNEYGGNVIDIDEICIAKEKRRTSLATELINWLEKEFSDDAVGFSLEIAHHNHAAQNLARKLGFSAVRNQHMIKIKETS
ncbi:MAG: GNAT family N-acetyltransferase [Candidatus Obscuribacterales bacterium]|nr:GNAT family N-acetyltransferase [Candidatus Obscuribacterales bacterium]